MSPTPEQPPPHPDADPSGIEEPHDVLAAEEFAMPTSDERLAVDPLHTSEPHDVLAAEEFAMPAPDATVGDHPGTGQPDRRPLLVAALIGFALAALLLRRR